MKCIAMAFVLLLALSCIALADDACDYKVEIIANGTDFAKEDFQWQMMATRLEGKPTNVTGKAEIMDLQGNVVKRYRPWTNEPISKQKTSSKYSPNLKEGSYKIVSEIALNCSDTNKNNNIDEKEIRIKVMQNEMQIAKENNILQQPLHEEAENNISSDKTSDPVILSTTQENNQTADVKQLEIKNSTNEEFDNEINLKESDKETNGIQPTAAVVKDSVIYESSNEKSKNFILFALLGISVLLNIVLIWKR